MSVSCDWKGEVSEGGFIHIASVSTGTKLRYCRAPLSHCILEMALAAGLSPTTLRSKRSVMYLSPHEV